MHPTTQNFELSMLHNAPPRTHKNLGGQIKAAKVPRQSNINATSTEISATCNPNPKYYHPSTLNHHSLNLHKITTKHKSHLILHKFSFQNTPKKYKNLGAPNHYLHTDAPSTHKNLRAIIFPLTCLLLFVGTTVRSKILWQWQGVVLAF